MRHFPSPWIRLGIVTALALAALAGCGREGEPGLNGIDGRGVLPAAAPGTYSWLKANVFEPSCTKCHNAEKPAGKLDLSSYEKASSGKHITAGNPEKSTLYTEVASGKMPKKAKKLSDEKIQAIYDWIAAGAKND